MRYTGPRLIDPLDRHGQKARQAFGVKSPREQDDDIRLAIEQAGNVPATVRPRITGSHGDGTASRGIVAALMRLGLVLDETDDDPETAWVPAGTGTPTAVAQTNAGTTATASITEGNDRNGVVRVTPGGAGIASGTQVQITFAVARADASYTVHVNRTDVGAGTFDFRPTGRTTTRWNLWVATALTSGTAYDIFYTVEDD